MSNPLFGNMKSEGLEQSQDRLGGYQPVESAIYEATLKMMYAGKSSGGAMSVTVIADLPGGQEYRETVYVSSKKGENFFTSKDGKKMPLPGFTVINDICLIATGKELAEQATEEKVVKIYNYEEKKEVPTNVPVLTECVGQKVALGILKQLENKNEKQGDEYVPTAETKETNLIDKVFHPEYKITVAEAREKQTEPKFWTAWEKRNKGQTRDRREIKDGGAASGSPPKAGAPGAAAKPKTSLFGK